MQRSAAKAGIKTADFYANDLGDNYIEIEGYEMRLKEQWEQARLQCYYTTLYGNSDQKKVGRMALHSFMPLRWDEVQKVVQKSPSEIQAEREEAKRQFHQRFPEKRAILEQKIKDKWQQSKKAS